MTTTASNKLLSSLTRKASVLWLLLLIVASILFVAPSAAMAQQQQQETTTAGPILTTTVPPLTPQEQQQQERLQNTIIATTRNLAQGQKEVDGVVYTPRWSDAVWVQPNSFSVLFVYCLPGEFADSGQEILGGSQLEVLESYSLAVTSDLTGWLMVVENENQTDRLPAAVGVVCSSDLNDAETRVVSPQEQTVINNIIKQFINIRNIQITNITQVINIINNVTTNQTGGVTPPTNETGGNDTGGVTPEPLTIGQIVWDTTDGGTAPATFEFTAEANGGTTPYTYHWDFGDGQQRSTENPTIFHTYENPGHYTATVTATDATGQTASDSTAVSVSPPLPNATGRLEIGWSSNPQDGTEAPASWCFNADVRGGVPPYTSYSWDFGDGGTASGQDVCHTFEQPGTYDVTLTATDSEGTVRSETGHITVDPPLETTTPSPTANETGVTELDTLGQ